ncbi:hypothetical protein PRIPAC_92407 [Pristionchus pacificus]|nr:hypothetical protein PRIPAC_92407 [Pristionchus pacificus]|eukprot:PDM80458.1 Ubiquitin [Pristionchus pacificus]
MNWNGVMSLLAFTSLISLFPDFAYYAIGFSLVLGLYLSWKTVRRDPLDYDIYIVETQADREASRRVAQASEERKKEERKSEEREGEMKRMRHSERNLAGNELMNTLQAGRVFPMVEDISVVIQSPSTIVESSSSRERPTDSYVNSMRLWMMEVIGDYESTREGGTSGLAAAVAIAVANGRNEIQTGETRIRLVDFDANRGNGEEEREGAGGNEEEGVERSSDDPIDSIDGNERREEGIEEILPSTSSIQLNGEDDVHLSVPSTSNQFNEEGNEERNNEEVEIRDEQLIKIRLKFLDDTGTDVEVPLSVTLAQLKEKIVEAREMGNINIRLIFRGQLLRNDSDTLESVGMENDCVVHVLIGGRREEERREERGGRGNERVEEVINMSALLLMGAADAIGSSWLSVARIIRNRVESRVERAREERRSLGYIDTALVWLAESMGITERAEAPLPGIPSISILLPVVLTIQIILGWFFVAFFPRFFDFSSIFFLFIITSTYGFFYQQNHARVNQRQ